MNKGEWSEPYVLLKLLADGKLFLGDENFDKIPEIIYPILKVLKHEKNRVIEFSYQDNLVVINYDGNSFSKPLADFISNAKICFQTIKDHKKGPLHIPKIKAFLNSFHTSESAAKAKHKQDITVQIEDPKSLISPALGFSIKSQLGGPSTLLNASGATNFIYTVSGRSFSNEEIEDINQIRSFSKKFEKIKVLGGQVNFQSVEHEIFRSNLQTIDTHFGMVLSDMILNYYQNSIPEHNTISHLVSTITQENKLNYNLSINPKMYSMMVKKFLVDYALGMRAADIWEREYQATGGYLIVRKDGEVLCYHFYFTKQFEDYLYKYTKLDTPSSTKHGFGKLYREGESVKIKLNLQIRFTV